MISNPVYVNKMAPFQLPHTPRRETMDLFSHRGPRKHRKFKFNKNSGWNFLMAYRISSWYSKRNSIYRSKTVHFNWNSDRCVLESSLKSNNFRLHFISDQNTKFLVYFSRAKIYQLHFLSDQNTIFIVYFSIYGWIKDELLRLKTVM